MAKANPITTMVVGLGRIGWRYHIAAAAKHPGFKVTAGVEVVPERRKECEETYGCRTFESIDAALAAHVAELAVIATRSIDHCEHAVKALEAGCHVFVDKPAAMNLAEMDRMIDAARRNKRVLTVNQSLRAHKDLLFVRETIDSGILGKVFWVKRGFAGGFYRRNDWQMEKRFGGGVFNNGGVHLTDAVLQLADAPVYDVWGDLKNTGASAGDADDFARVSIRTGDGRLIEFTSTYTTAFGEPEWLVCGNCGTLQIDSHESGSARLKYFDPAKAPRRELEGPVPAGREYRIADDIPWVEKEVPIEPKTAYPDWYDNLYDVIRNGAAPNVTPESVRLTIEVMDLVRKSSQWKY
jgi:predicted dehydrogenase